MDIRTAINLIESAQATDFRSNWKTFDALPPSTVVKMYHATSLNSAEAIVRDGFSASKKVWSDSHDGYVYLGGSIQSLAIYAVHAVRSDDKPVIMVVHVRKADIEPDAGKDWASYLRRHKNDVISLFGKDAIKHPTPTVTLAEIGQVRAPESKVTPVAILDINGDPLEK